MATLVFVLGILVGVILMAVIALLVNDAELDDLGEFAQKQMREHGEFMEQHGRFMERHAPRDR